MIDKNKTYTADELLQNFAFSNISFKFFGNNDKGELEMYVKTGADKVSVFKSSNHLTKKEYLDLDEDQARQIKYVYDREVDIMDLDIVAIVLRTSDINIPSGRYTLKTLNDLVKEQNQEDRVNTGEEKDGFLYQILDNTSGLELYSNTYIFDKSKTDFISELKDISTKADDKNIKDNLDFMLDYYDKTKENEMTL